jgi:hypothetical protein
MVHEDKSLVRRRVTAIGIAAILLVAAVWLLTPLAVRGLAHSALSAMGFNDARGGTVSLGPRHLRLSGIAIGRKSRATVTVTFSPGSLLHARLETIAITDTTLHGVVALNGTVALDGFAFPAPKPGPASPLSLPVQSVTIDGLSLELETPAGPATLTGAGTLTGTENGLRLTGAADLVKGEIKGAAPIDFTVSPTGWSLALNPIRIAFPPETDAPKTDAPNAVEGQLTIAKSGDSPMTGDAKLDGAKLTIGAVPISTLSLNFHTGAEGQTGTLKLVPADGGGLDGDLTNGPTGLTANLKASLAEIGAIAKAFGAGTVSGPVRASLSLHADQAVGPRPILLTATYDGATPGGAVLRNAKLREAGLFDAAANAVTLTSCGALSADAVSLGGLTFAKVLGCLGPMEDAPLFSQDKAGAISLAGAFATLSATAASGTANLAEVALKSIAASARLADGKIAAFAFKTNGGTVGLPALGTGFRDLAANGASAADGSVSGTVTGSFAAAGPKSPVLPIIGTIGGTLADGVTLALTVGSTEHLPIIKATVSGQSAKLDMAATTLGEGGADLIGLMPGLATSVSKLSGTLAVNLAADWSGSAPVSHGTITAKNIGATTPNFTIAGLDATVALTSLKPLTTANDQTLTMKTLLVGVPLTDGRIVFGLNKHQILNIAEAGWTIAGGTVGTRDQQLDLYGPDQNLGVVVRDVDIAQLLVLVGVNGLSAKGTLQGAIPLRHTKDTILVEHGYLQTKAPGLISYDPTETPSFLQGQPGEGTAILRDALKDFHYDQLSLTIDGTLGGEEKIKMSLKGANPKVYGGSAIALNLNLSGALDSIARSSVEAYTHPAETARKLRKKTGEKN